MNWAKLFLDGTWTPYYADLRLLLVLEFLTFALELLGLWSWNRYVIETEKRWSRMDIFAATLVINMVSFIVLLPIAIYF